MTLLKAISDNTGKVHSERIGKLKEFLSKNSEIVINKEVFESALSIKPGVDIRRVIVYLILCHCIERNSARSEGGDKLPFQDVIEHLEEAIGDRIYAKNNPIRNPNEEFHAYLNFRDKKKNTLLHQAVISDNTEAITTLLKYNADSLMQNAKSQTPLDLAQGERTKQALIDGMGDQANSKKGSARDNAIMVGFFCAVIGVGISSGICIGIGSSLGIVLGVIAVSTLVAGLAAGLASYFLSQDREQAKAIEKAIGTSSKFSPGSAYNANCGLERR